MMWVVVEIGKKQYIARKGDILAVPRQKEKEGEILLDKVLLLAEDKGIKLGTPYLDKVRVKAQVLKEKKGKKVIVYKYKRRKKYRKKLGHRQIYTLLKVSDITTSLPRRVIKK